MAIGVVTVGSRVAGGTGAPTRGMAGARAGAVTVGALDAAAGARGGCPGGPGGPPDRLSPLLAIVPSSGHLAAGRSRWLVSCTDSLSAMDRWMSLSERPDERLIVVDVRCPVS